MRFRLPVLLAGALWACASAWSQTVLDNAALLGMSRQQVMPALVNAQPVRSPRRLPPLQLSVLTGTDAPPELDLAGVVRRTVDVVVKQTIDIPRIAVVPKGAVTSGFNPFTLDVAGLHLQPKDRSLVGQTLRTHEQFTLSAQSGRAERRLEDYTYFPQLP